MSFDNVLDAIPEHAIFFAGMRNLEFYRPNSDPAIDDACIGSIKGSRVILGAISVFKETWIWDEKTQTIVTLPQGGNIGRFLYRFLGFDTFLLGHRYFYDSKATPGMTVILNTDNIGSWRLKKRDAFSKCFHRLPH